MNDTPVHSTKCLLVNVASADDRPARHVTTAQGFGQRDDVGLEVPMLESKHFAGPSQTALNFVANEKCAVFAAELLRAREEICGWRFAPFALHRLDDKSGDIAFGQLALERGDVIQRNAGIPLIHERAETFRKTFASHQRQRSDAESVKGALERDNALLSGGGTREF